MAVIRRLPKYYRLLSALERKDTTRISSHELSEKLGFTASQIRQDLNVFGGFGQQGYGYRVSDLKREIGSILGLDSNLSMILVGAGNLGKALINHFPFWQSGFDLIGIFDVSEKVIGTTLGGIEVFSGAVLEDFCRTKKPEAAILALPTEFVQKSAEQLYGLGVKGFWNFTDGDINVPGACIEDIRLVESLMTFRFMMSRAK